MRANHPLTLVTSGTTVRQCLGTVALLLLAGCSGSSEPRPDTRDTPIMFRSSRSGTSGIFLMSADGQRVVPFGPGDGAWPGDWSPSGAQLVFVRRDPTTLWIAHYDGAGVRQLVSSSSPVDHARWMPNGSISYADYSGGSDWGISEVNVDGSGGHRVPNTYRANGDHSWSPDARRLVYELEETVSIPGSSDSKTVLSLFVADTAASVPVRLTTNTDCGDFQPDWSPDGTKIAFASCANNLASIVVIAPDGSGRVALTDGRTFDRHPSWSPDSRHIVFERGEGTSDDIWMMSADGTNQVNLTASNPDFDGNPVWRRALLPR
jgi:Tol biopolymer transport system component